MAIDVVENDYVLEFLIDGVVVARHPDVELEHEKNRVLTLVGDPQPSADATVLRRHVLEQEFQLPPGVSQPDVVTPPTDPLATADLNAPLQFACDPLELWEANSGAAPVSVTDPDGVVTNLSITWLEPQAGGIALGPVTPAADIGEPASATVVVGADVAAGDYDVVVTANTGSLGEHASARCP